MIITVQLSWHQSFQPTGQCRWRPCKWQTWHWERGPSPASISEGSLSHAWTRHCTLPILLGGSIDRLCVLSSCSCCLGFPGFRAVMICSPIQLWTFLSVTITYYIFNINITFKHFIPFSLMKLILSLKNKKKIGSKYF